MEWLKTHKLHLISGAVILLLLIGTFFMGGNRQTAESDAQAPAQTTEAVSDELQSAAPAAVNTQPAASAVPSPSAGVAAAAAENAPSASTTPTPGAAEEAQTTAAAESEAAAAAAAPSAAPEAKPSPDSTGAAAPEAAAAETEGGNGTEGTPDAAPVQEATGEQPQEEPEQPAPEAPETEPEAAQPDAVQEPEPETQTVDSSQCTISISCATILNHQDACSDAVWSLVPADGWILQTVTVDLQEGDSVFDILQRVCTEYGIQLEFSRTPGLNSVYIEGIQNLYEFDVGELSGWMYCVNGVYPNYGCSEYAVSTGDEICFRYTCDLGDDIGGSVN